MDKYQDMVYAYALRSTKDSEEAEDVTQEVFLKAFESLSKYQGSAKFSTWLYSITKNELIARYQKVRKKQEIQQAKKSILQDEYKRSQEQNAPELGLLKEEMHAQMRNLLAKLPITYKKPLVLYYFENKSYKEIAESMNVKMNTLKSYIFRGKQILKDWLRTDYDEP
ncbi:MAG: sigma-70 family RNA polymerase sigma factor [Spirochaetota bacterium]